MGRAPGSESHTCGPPLSGHCGCGFGTQSVRRCMPHALARGGGVASGGKLDWGAMCRPRPPPCPLFSWRVIYSGHGVFQWVQCVSGQWDPGGD